MDKTILFLNLLSAVAILRNIKYWDRLLIVLVILGIQAIFIGIGDIDDAFTYYGSAATMDLLTIYAISKISTSKFALDMERICFASLIINALGYVGYEMHMRAKYYNAALMIALAVQLVRMLIVTKDDERDSKNSNICRMVVRTVQNRSANRRRYEEKER